MIDMDRICMMGNSGGGTTTIYATALDTRIKAAMPSCALCGYYASIGAMQHCPCNYIPGIMKHFDMGDLAVMIAPKKLVVVCGKDDNIFPLDGVNEKGLAVGVLQLQAPATAQDNGKTDVGRKCGRCGAYK